MNRETQCEVHFYGITGQKLASYSCGYHDAEGGDGTFYWSLKGYNIYFAGHLVQSNGVSVTTDRLGSVRANGSGERFNYLPYGEERTSTADGREKFATYIRDSGGLDYADQRYYDRGSGRFLTADPSSGNNAADPGSWNKYGYVGGDPINFADPSGLARCSAVSSFTTNSDPDTALNSMMTAEIQCTSTAGSVFAWQYVTFSSGASPGDIRAAADSLGTTVDQTERANFTALLGASIKRVQADLLKSDCAKDFRDAAAASKKAGTIGFSDQGMLQYTQQDGIITPKRRSPGVASYKFTGSINLNSTVDWSFPSSTNALLDGASYMVDLLAGQAASLGVSSVSADQFMDLTILHELSHYRGAIGNPDTNPSVEKALWNDCIK